MKKVIILLPVFMFLATITMAQVQTVSSDKDWSSQQAEIKNAYEAEFIIRTGDVDNLGFGWPENFDPFCGRMTDAHGYPWEINPDDLPGMTESCCLQNTTPANRLNAVRMGIQAHTTPKRRNR